MRNNKGFTLIELLAVIVVLAIIALIATPMVLDTIESARKGAKESSAYAYIGSVETAIAGYMLEHGGEEPNSVNDLSIDVKGDTPDLAESKVCLVDGIVSEAILKYDNYTVYYDGTAHVDNDKTKDDIVCGKVYTNGEVVYYNPNTNTKCESSEAVSTTGTKSGCMKWYAFNDTESASKVNLLLDHNTTATVAWNSSGNNAGGPITVNAQLATDTQGWYGNPRLIEATEVNQIVGKTDWTSNGTWYCLKSKTHDSENSPYCYNSGTTYGWLYDHTYCIEGSNNWYCSNNDTSNYGYWTSTPHSGDADNAWLVYRDGSLSDDDVGYAGTRGVRPVITISKSIIS